MLLFNYGLTDALATILYSLYRGSLNGPSDIISYYLDPTNTTYAVPDDWFLIEVDSSKMIASKTQYNTIACP